MTHGGGHPGTRPPGARTLSPVTAGRSPKPRHRASAQNRPRDAGSLGITVVIDQQGLVLRDRSHPSLEVVSAVGTQLPALRSPG